MAKTYTDAAAVTPHDTTANVYDALYIGTAGTLKVKTFKDSTVEFGNVAAGSTITLSVKLVYNTDTSASNIVGLKY
jgi:hypothetical protein